MGNHRVTIVTIGEMYQGRCSCRRKGAQEPQRWAADDWCRDHLALIEQVRTHLRGQPTLKQSANYYRLAAQDPVYTPEQQDVWLSMAEELEARINANESGIDQLQLW